MKEKQSENIEEPFKREARKAAPPYLSVVKFKKLIELLSNRNFNEVSVALLQKGDEFNKLDGTLAVSGLRFLGFIDDDGRATESMKKLRLSGEERRKAFEEIVRDAYSKIFKAVDEPQKLPNSQLKTELRRQYDIGERVALAAVPVLRQMLIYAGLLEESSVIRKSKEGATPKSSKPKPKKETSPASSRGRSVGFTEIEFLKGEVVVSISEATAKKALLESAFRDRLDTFIEAGKNLGEELEGERLPQAESVDG